MCVCVFLCMCVCVSFYNLLLPDVVGDLEVREFILKVLNEKRRLYTCVFVCVCTCFPVVVGGSEVGEITNLLYDRHGYHTHMDKRLNSILASVFFTFNTACCNMYDTIKK